MWTENFQMFKLDLEKGQHIKKQRHYFAKKDPSSQSYGFSSSHVWMWALDYKESWAPKNWCFWTVVLEKTLESPLDCKEIQPVHPKGNRSWIFIGRTDAKAETPILWPPDAKSWLILKRPRGWERLKAGGEGNHRGWDGWMASPTQWTWVWVNSGIWWWTGRPCVLQSQQSQSQTRLSDWTDLNEHVVAAEEGTGHWGCRRSVIRSTPIESIDGMSAALPCPEFILLVFHFSLRNRRKSSQRYLQDGESWEPVEA